MWFLTLKEAYISRLHLMSQCASNVKGNIDCWHESKEKSRGVRGEDDLSKLSLGTNESCPMTVVRMWRNEVISGQSDQWCQPKPAVSPSVSQSVQTLDSVAALIRRASSLICHTASWRRKPSVTTWPRRYLGARLTNQPKKDCFSARVSVSDVSVLAHVWRRTPPAWSLVTAPLHLPGVPLTSKHTAPLTVTNKPTLF